MCGGSSRHGHQGNGSRGVWVSRAWHYLENGGENVSWLYDCDEAADLILHVQDPLK